MVLHSEEVYIFKLGPYTSISDFSHAMVLAFFLNPWTHFIHIVTLD